MKRPNCCPKSGVLYGFATYEDFGGKWSVSIIKKAPHRYGKHTSFGERVKMREFSRFSIASKLPDRASAVQAAKSWIKAKLQPEPVTP